MEKYSKELHLYNLSYCSFSFFQHVDDSSIIMADQTVIKKGECFANVWP